MCGIIGMAFENNYDQVAPNTYTSLYHQQHRGADSAGIAVEREDGSYQIQKGPGTLDYVFAHKSAFRSKEWVGALSVGQVRYSTSGVDYEDPFSVEQANLAAQPFKGDFRGKKFFMVYNGNLTPDCCDELHKKLYKQEFNEEWTERNPRVDTELIAKTIELSRREIFLDAVLKDMCPNLRGAFSIILLYDGGLYVIRDRHGFRPCELGKHKYGYVLSSEDNVCDRRKFPGNSKIRSIRPGECLVIQKMEDGSFTLTSHQWKQTPEEKQHFCQFELVYFKRFDSSHNGKSLAYLRDKLGKQLARECPPPPNIDIVLGVPDSGCAAAWGYAEELKIPYDQRGLQRLHNTGRSFLEPVHFLRKEGIEMKLTVIPEFLEGKNIVVVDDSVVRGNVISRIVYLLKDAGAREVHFRVSSPPVIHGCWYGIDTYRIEDELIARQSKDINEIIRRINQQVLLQYGCSYTLDSLSYISLEGMEKTWKQEGIREGLCNACWTGNYPER